MNFFAGCQNSLPELLCGCELPPTLIDLLLEDAPKVLSRVEDGDHTMSLSPLMPIAAKDAEVFLAA